MAFLEITQMIQSTQEVLKRTLRDFETDDAGTVTAWQGGAMERIPGECRFSVRFEPDDDAPSDAFADLVGVGELVSSDPRVRSLRLTVSEIYTFYPK
jgi:hypothetical protein